MLFDDIEVLLVLSKAKSLSEVPSCFSMAAIFCDSPGRDMYS